MSAWARIAEITKTRNLNGSLVVRMRPGLSCVPEPGMDVHFVPPTLRGPRHGIIADVQRLHEGEYQVDFEGMTGIDDVEMLVGSSCLVAKDALPEHYDRSEAQAVIDYTVCSDSFGTIGRIVAIEEGAAQSILVVEGAYGQVLIPIVDEFIIDVSDAEHIVSVNIPESLLKLNGSE